MELEALEVMPEIINVHLKVCEATVYLVHSQTTLYSS